MFKKLGVAVLGLLCIGALSFAALTPEIERDENGVPGAAVSGKSPAGTRVEMAVDANGNVGTTPATGSTTTVKDERYAGKVSSGTAGLITGVTTSTITVLNNVARWSFLYKDVDNVGAFCNIKPSVWSVPIYLEDGDRNTEIVDIPRPITFILSGLSLASTTQWSVTVVW